MPTEAEVVGYNSAAASYGFQAGVQAFGYALFFMTDSALDYLDKSGGFELGTGPSIVILDTGGAAAFTSTTRRARRSAGSIADESV